MKLHLLLFVFLLTTARVFAQDNLPYAEKAAQIQKDVWGNQAPEFKATTIPANLSKESAVILAHSYSSQRTSNSKFKFLVISAAVTARTVMLNTLHERVKINDKLALENYSSLEYQKKLDKTVSLLIAKFSDVHNTFIGVKIIKPDGKEVIVNTSEGVLTKNETKDQKGKLAIPGLQVGDILDYYISNFSITEKSANESYSGNDDIFMLADEYPVLYYSIDFQFSKKVEIKCIYGNGAPHFEESRNDAGDLLLNLKARNLPKFQSQLWTSPFRQYPYIEIGSSFDNNFGNLFGGSKKADNETMLDKNKIAFESGFTEFTDFDLAEKRLKDYFKGNKAMKKAPLDSVMKVFYDEWKFNTFCYYQGNELEHVSDMNYRTANSKFCTVMMSMMLTDMEINHDILLVAPRNSNSLENVYGPKDFVTMIRINGDTPMYMAFDDVVTHFNEIPARFQGEKVNVIHATRHNAMKYSFTAIADDVLPVMPSDKNRSDQQMQVNLMPGNMQKLKIVRTVKETGTMRHDGQKMLIPVQDVDRGYMDMVNGETLAKRLSKARNTKKMADDYVFSFNREHDEMSKNFTNEIKVQYDQEPQQVADYKIINPALESSAPVFEYSASFVLDNLVKKAGDNYIVDAGKLTGAFLKLDEKDENRSVDIYMPSARSFSCSINFTIPQGYSVKGVEELNQKKANKTGSFSSSAAVKGNMLSITVNRVYTHNFEKVADWPLLKDLIKAASAFNDQKILLEKNG